MPLIAESVVCMETASGSELNCRANDVQLGQVTNLALLDGPGGEELPGDPTCSCAIDPVTGDCVGDPVTVRATFEM
jgi:hypothetical protein